MWRSSLKVVYVGCRLCTYTPRWSKSLKAAFLCTDFHSFTVLPAALAAARPQPPSAILSEGPHSRCGGSIQVRMQTQCEHSTVHTKGSFLCRMEVLPSNTTPYRFEIHKEKYCRVFFWRRPEALSAATSVCLDRTGAETCYL